MSFNVYVGEIPQDYKFWDTSNIWVCKVSPSDGLEQYRDDLSEAFALVSTNVRTWGTVWVQRLIRLSKSNWSGAKYIVINSVEYGLTSSQTSLLVDWLRKVSIEKDLNMICTTNSPVVLDWFQDDETIIMRDGKPCSFSGGNDLEHRIIMGV